MAEYARDPHDILALYKSRQTARGPVIEAAKRVRDNYNGDIVVPLPELDRDEQSYVANLLTSGLDSYGQRIASLMPKVACPPLRPRIQASVEKSETRRKTYLTWWEQNRLRLKMRRRARHLIGYASSPVLVLPDFDRGIPRWEIRNPLSTYPAPSSDPDEMTPADIIFCVRKSVGELRRQPAWRSAVAAAIPPDVPDEAMRDVLEYMDGEQITWLLRGHGSDVSTYGTADVATLEQAPNRTGMCPAVVPGRITLDRPMGQFDGIIGMFQAQAKLAALEVHAVTKGVFPDTYLISRPNEQAQFISGPHPGYTGEVNIVEGGELREVQVSPSFMTNTTIDRLERSQRVAAGISPEMGGESGSNIRTGRRGDQVMSAMVDFPVQEAQEVLGASLEEENRRACAVARSYFGQQAKSFYLKAGPGKGPVDYIPERDFETDANTVAYAMAGADVNNLTVGLGQRVGTGMMSKGTARKLDPYVDDPEMEGDAVTVEGLEAALLSSLQNQAASGALSPADLARIMSLVKSANLDLADAVSKVHEEAQVRQASSGPEGAPDGPVDPASPAAQPGLAAPGQGAEAGQPQIGPPPPSMQNLSSLLSTLRAG